MGTLGYPRRAMAILIILAALAPLPAQAGKGAATGSAGGSEAGSGAGAGGGSSGNSGSGAAQGRSADTGPSSGREAAAPGNRASPPSDEESFARWCSSELAASFPADATERIAGMFLPLVRDGFPQTLIRGRIAEAASKKVAAAPALEAFKRDAEDFRFLMERTRAAKWPAVPSRESFYSDASAALRNGLDRSAAETVYALSRMVKLDPKRAGAALTAASAFKSGYSASDEEVADLAGALATSRIPARKIASVLGLAAKAKSSGMRTPEILSRVMDGLKTGGSIAEIEKRLSAAP